MNLLWKFGKRFSCCTTSWVIPPVCFADSKLMLLFFFNETLLSVTEKIVPNVPKRMIHRGSRPCRSYLNLIFLHALNIYLDHIVVLCRSLYKSSSCLLILCILLVSIPEMKAYKLLYILLSYIWLSILLLWTVYYSISSEQIQKWCS